MSQLYNFGNTSGIADSNTPIGTNAMIKVFGINNTAMGGSALTNLTSGSNNTAVGSIAMENNIVGNDNVSLGYNTLSFANSASNCVAVGSNALASFSGNTPITAVGFNSLTSLTSGARNTGVGANTLEYTTVGVGNTASGYYALRLNNTGNNNTAVGDSALSANVSANFCSAFGSNALIACTADNNTAIGANASNGITTGFSNTSVGSDALYTNSIGINNTAMGKSALSNLTTGATNIGIGVNVGSIPAQLLTGNNNILIGGPAGVSDSADSQCICIGNGAYGGTLCTIIGHGAYVLASTTSGVAIGEGSYVATNCSAIGANAIAITTGTTALGVDTFANHTNSIALGKDATTSAANTCVIQTGTGATLGNLSFNGNTIWDGSFAGVAQDIQVNAAGDFITAALPSDSRIKENVEEISTLSQLDKLLQLRTVSYEYSGRFKKELGDGVRIGLIAQELQKVMPELVKSSSIYLNDEKMEDWANGVPPYTIEEYETANGQNKIRHIPKQYEPPSDPILTIDFKSMVPRLIAGVQALDKKQGLIQQLASDNSLTLSDHYDTLGKHYDSLTDNKTILNEHRDILNSHDKQLAEHLDIINEHQDILDFYVTGEFNDTHDFAGAKSSNNPKTLELLMQTRPVTYKPGEDHPYVGKGERVGLITSELQKSAPEYVLEFEGLGDTDEPKLRPDYAAMVPMLIASIQSQQKTIEKLTGRISVLERNAREDVKKTAPAAREKNVKSRNK